MSRCVSDPSFGWIVSKWPPGERRLALGMDATTLSDRFTVLCVSVLYRGCAIPVAWKVLCSGEKGSWQPHWKALLTCLQASVPKGWTVIVLADRGLYAPWLYCHLVTLGWHPFLRIKPSRQSPSAFSAERFDWLSSLVPKPGTAWSGVVDCFVERTIRCTLLARLRGRLCRCLVGGDRSSSRGGKRWCGTACAAGSKAVSRIPNTGEGLGIKPR